MERRFSVFPVSVFGQDWVLKCSQRHEACKVLAQSPEPMSAINSLSDSNNLDCGLKFKHQIFGYLWKFSRPFSAKLTEYSNKCNHGSYVGRSSGQKSHQVEFKAHFHQTVRTKQLLCWSNVLSKLYPKFK